MGEGQGSSPERLHARSAPLSAPLSIRAPAAPCAPLHVLHGQLRKLRRHGLLYLLGSGRPDAARSRHRLLIRLLQPPAPLDLVGGALLPLPLLPPPVRLDVPLRREAGGGRVAAGHVSPEGAHPSGRGGSSSGSRPTLTCCSVSSGNSSCMVRRVQGLFQHTWHERGMYRDGAAPLGHTEAHSRPDGQQQPQDGQTLSASCTPLGLASSSPPSWAIAASYAASILRRRHTHRPRFSVAGGRRAEGGRRSGFSLLSARQLSPVWHTRPASPVTQCCKHS